MPDQAPSSRLSDRARCILAGLIKSGRAEPLLPGRQPVTRGMLQLDHPRGGLHFWLAIDGSRLLRGRDVVEAEPLQEGFIAAMAKRGGWRDPEPEPAPAPREISIASPLGALA
jgi:hypothetical protein